MIDIVPASEIVDDVLNQTGQALIDGDFETFLNHFHLPQIIETFEGRQDVKTAEDLKTLFMSVRAFHKSQEVNRLVRSCHHAEYKSEDTIEGVFDALLFRDTQLVQSMPSTFLMLTRHAGIWKISYNMYGVTTENGFGKALIDAPDLQKKDAASGYPVRLQAS